MKIKNKINYLLNRRQKIYLFFLLIGSLILTFLEMIGIGSIGIFVAVLSDSQIFIEKIPFEKVQIFLQELKIDSLIIFSGILLTLVFIFKNIVIIIYNYFELKVRKNITLNFSKNTYSNYLYRDINFHKKKNTAELINNITSKTNNAVQYLFTLISIFKEIILIIFLIYGLMWLNLNFSMYVFFAITILSSLLYFGIKNVIKKIGQKAMTLEEKRLQSLNEGLGGIKITKVLNNYNFFIKEFAVYHAKRFDLDLIVRILNLLPRLFLEILAIVSMAFVTIYLMRINSSLNEVLPLLTVISVIIIRMIPAFTNLSMSLQNIRYMNFSFNDISEELKEDFKSKNNPDTTFKNFKNISDIQSLSITNLNFSYENKKDLIKNLNISLKKGQLTGLIGNTGSGKTTLIDIILGLIEPDTGKFIINHEHELKDFKTLNHLVGYVPQEIYLSDTSIIKNIAVGIDEKNIDIDRVNKVIELSQLNKFIETLDEGIYSKVGDRAFRISGGQKQRIGIARALYRNPKILIMDESTNSLDEQTEKLFLKDIKNISKELITIFVTHKIKNLSYCDVVYRLENGKLN